MNEKTDSRTEKTLTLQQAIDLGVQHHNAGDLPKAESIYQQILKADPDQPVALHLLGVIAHQVGKIDVAIELIGKAVAIKPDYPDAHNNLGNALKALGNLDQAAESYKKVLSLKPDYAEVHNNLGLVLGDLGGLDEAVASFQKAVAIKPDYAQAHCNLGNAFKDLAKMDEAIACYREALTISPDFPEALINVGIAYKEIGLLDEAVAAYKKMLDIDPELAEAHNNLGNAYKELGRFDDAIASYLRVLDIRPDLPDTHNNLGLAYKKLGQLDKAVSCFQKSIGLKSDYFEAHCNLGNTFRVIGKLDEAIESYCNAITINPDFEEGWNNFMFAAKARVFSLGTIDVADSVPRDTIYYALYNYYLESFMPHQLDETFHNTLAAMPSKFYEDISIEDTPREPAALSELPKNLVTLLHFGRSGTGLLHSLIDSHPEISTLPSIYLRGFFNSGVWDRLAGSGWRYLPERFAKEFKVLFDAKCPNPVPSRMGESGAFLGQKEGMTALGENRNEALSLDRDLFCAEALKLIEGLDKIDPGTFLRVVHAAFEKTLGTQTKKNTVFYHIHNPDNFATLNSIKFLPCARSIMMVREPIQCCESWLRVISDDDNYEDMVQRIVGMLFSIDQIAFRMQESVGVRLEDLKNRPEATMRALCKWLGVEEAPSLYQMTAQGKKWWGDPSSPDFQSGNEMSPFEDSSIKRSVGAIFSNKDQFIFRTLYYPFRVRFGYAEDDPQGFANDLQDIRPLLDDLMDFEIDLIQRTNKNPTAFKAGGDYLLLRACLMDRWNVLNEFHDYPHLLTPLSIANNP